MLDLYDRKVIGRVLCAGMEACETTAALEMAVKNRVPQGGLIFHSDRGVQYAPKASAVFCGKDAPRFVRA